MTVEAPATISRDRLLAFVESLGVDPADAVELHITPHQVELVVLARNERGAAFCHPDGAPAHHTIALDIE